MTHPTACRCGGTHLSCDQPEALAAAAVRGGGACGVRGRGRAVIRGKSLNGEYDAAHMLSPMPLAISVGAGSNPIPWSVAAIENVNGQAIVLANKHKERRDPRDWRGQRCRTTRGGCWTSWVCRTPRGASRRSCRAA